MARWLDRFLPPPTGKKPGLPSVEARRPGLPTQPLVAAPDQLPNASLVYGVAAAVLLVLCLYFLFTGRWFTGLILLLPTACLFGFAVHFIRHHR